MAKKTYTAIPEKTYTVDEFQSRPEPIENGKLTGERSVTLQDVADRCGVTKSTVSRALRGDTQHVGEVMKNNIINIAKEMGYDHSYQHAARRLAFRRIGRELLNQLVMVYVPANFYEMDFFRHIYHGILSEMIERKFGLVTYYMYRPAEDVIPPFVRFGNVDGIIMVENVKRTETFLAVVRSEPNFGQKPIVSVMEQRANCSNILADWRSGAYQIALHLLNLGHRHILSFFGDKDADIYKSQKMLGYKEAYQEKGLDAAQHLHFLDHEHDFWVPEGVKSFDKEFLQVMKSHPEITAVIARNDPMAAKCFSLVQSMGLSVPNDVSIVGHDDTDPIRDNSGENILTSVRLPLEEIGREAAKLLIRRIVGDTKQDQMLILPVELVVRKSTGPVHSRS